MVLWRCGYRGRTGGGGCAARTHSSRSGPRGSGRDGHGRLPRLYRHPQPFACPANVRSARPLQGHSGSHDRDHGRGLDSRAVWRAYSRSVRRCLAEAAYHAWRVDRACAELDTLPRLVGCPGWTRCLAQYRLLSGRRHTAGVRERLRCGRAYS